MHGAGPAEQPDPQAAQHLGQVFALGVDAQAGFGNPLQASNDGLLLAVDVFERDLDLPLQAVVDLFVTFDVAFVKQDLGDRLFGVAGRHDDRIMLGHLGIADASKHIANGVIYDHDGTSFLPAGLADAGDLTFVGQFPETDAAHTVAAQH